MEILYREIFAIYLYNRMDVSSRLKIKHEFHPFWGEFRVQGIVYLIRYVFVRNMPISERINV